MQIQHDPESIFIITHKHHRLPAPKRAPNMKERLYAVRQVSLVGIRQTLPHRSCVKYFYKLQTGLLDRGVVFFIIIGAAAAVVCLPFDVLIHHTTNRMFVYTDDKVYANALQDQIHWRT